MLEALTVVNELVFLWLVASHVGRQVDELP